MLTGVYCGNCKERERLGILRHRREDNIKMNPEVIYWKAWTGLV